MKKQTPIIIISIIGILTLFFFPSPEENFLYYLGTIGLFVVVIIILSKSGKKKKDRRR